MIDVDRAVSICIDSANKRADLPDHDPALRCPEHPRAARGEGFGLAGGGFGIYTYCSVCGDVLSKSEVEE